MSRITRSGARPIVLGVGLLAGAWALAATAADARVYVSAGAGAGYAPNGSFDGADTHVDFDLGRPIGQVAVGLDPPGGWRFELDASYRNNDAEVVFFDDGRSDVAPDGDSSLSALGLTLSALRDFDTGLGFRPFVGAGLGVARIDYELRQYITEVLLLDDHDTALTWQLMAGFALDLTPRLGLSADYRLWQAGDIELENAAGEPFDTEHRVHSVTVNVRYDLSGVASGAQTAVNVATTRPEPTHGWYLQAAAGPTFAKDAEIKNNIANFDAFDVGSVAALSIGYAFRGAWRLELEGAWRRNEAELVDFNPEFGEDRANGRVSADSVMVNARYAPRRRAAFRPYVLLGVGVAWSEWDVSLNADGRTYVDDQDAAAAFQVGLGVSAPLTARLAVAAEYRYWMTDLFDLEEPDGRPMRTEHTVHSVMLGIRYSLGGR